MAKPSAIITSLEDCPDWLDRGLAKAYWEAEYFLPALDLQGTESYLLRLGQPMPGLISALQMFDVQRFAILTAFNPASVLLSATENRSRNALLRERLAPYTRLMYGSRSQSRDGHWVEDGFWALDIDLERAAAIGLDFGQAAIVCWEKGALPALWWL